MPPPPIPDKIPCTTPAQLEQELRDLRPILTADETEDNWEQIARALQKLASMTRGGAAKIDPDFVKALKGLSRHITSAMCSERTRLSAAAVDLVATFAPRLAERFDSIMPLYMPELLKLCSRTNKLFIARAQKTLLVIVSNNKLPSLLPYLREAVKDKSQTLRLVAIEATVACMDEYDEKVLRSKVEDVEAILKSTATDSHPEVRKISKKLFEAYKVAFPERVEDFTNPLTPITRRYLDIATRQEAATSKGGPPPRKPEPPATKASSQRKDLSASTSALPNTALARPTGHVRSTSSSTLRSTDGNGTGALGQPVRPRLMASQSERPPVQDVAARPRLLASQSERPLVQDLAAQPVPQPAPDSRSRAPSVSSGASSRPTSALSIAPLTKPFAPVRSVSTAAAPQRPKQTSSAPVVDLGKVLASSRPQRAPAPPSATAPPSTSGAVRPPLTRPPTAPASLMTTSASRRPVHPSDTLKGPTPGKSMLQGGAKRIQTKPVKPPIALANALRKDGFVPNRGSARSAHDAAAAPVAHAEELGTAGPTQQASLHEQPEFDGEAEAVAELPEGSNVSNPTAAAGEACIRMEAIEEDVDLSIDLHEPVQEEAVREEAELRLEDLQVDVREGPDEDTAPVAAVSDAMAPEVVPNEPSTDPLGHVVPTPMGPAEPSVQAPQATSSTPAQKSDHHHRRAKDASRPPLSPETKARRRAEREQARLAAEADAIRAIRREEKRRAYEAMTAEEREAQKVRRRQKRERKMHDQDGADLQGQAAAQADLDRAASMPLPEDDEEPHYALPAIDVDHAASIPLPDDWEPTHMLPVVDLDFAASIPLPDIMDDDFLPDVLTGVTLPRSTYTVSLPQVRIPPARDFGASLASPANPPESPTSSSCSSTPEEVNFSGSTIPYGGTDAEDDEDDLAGVEFRDGRVVLLSPAAQESCDVKHIGGGKEVRPAADRVFQEVDINIVGV